MSAVMPWIARAACHGKAELFYPEEHGNEAAQNAKVQAAKVICATCPVLRDCARWALLTPEPHGIWGGMTVRERGRVRKRMGKRPTLVGRSLQPCGTPAAIRRHQRHGEPLCGACVREQARVNASKKAAA